VAFLPYIFIIANFYLNTVFYSIPWALTLTQILLLYGTTQLYLYLKVYLTIKCNGPTFSDSCLKLNFSDSFSDLTWSEKVKGNDGSPACPRAISCLYPCFAWVQSFYSKFCLKLTEPFRIPFCFDSIQPNDIRIISKTCLPDHVS
jgi:hypothetical protein